MTTDRLRQERRNWLVRPDNNANPEMRRINHRLTSFEVKIIVEEALVVAEDIVEVCSGFQVKSAGLSSNHAGRIAALGRLQKQISILFVDRLAELEELTKGTASVPAARRANPERNAGTENRMLNKSDCFA